MDAKHLLLAVSLCGGVFAFPNSALAQDWTLTSAPITNWQTVASSADGSRFVAAVYGGLIYTSTNSGATWVETSAPSTNWESVFSSADGSTLLAVANEVAGYYGSCWLFTSTNSGATWAQASLTNPVWHSAVMSADGMRMLAVSADTYMGGPVYVSTNCGGTWATQSSAFRVRCVAGSADGSRLVMSTLPLPSYGLISTSTNSGRSWELTSAPYGNWEGVASSADGRVLLAQPFSSSGGGLLLSTNSGGSWTEANVPGPNWYWCFAAVSLDGTKLFAIADRAYYPGQGNAALFTSTDFGATWAPANTPPATNWVSVASSADGNRLVALASFYPNGGAVFTSQCTPVPVLSITPSGSDCSLCWTVPSIPFVLQETADLSTPHWTDVSTPPTLNFTNLQNQVIVPSSSSNRFFRLKGL